jgi:hypothetical protein
MLEQCGVAKALAGACKACTQKIVSISPGIGSITSDAGKEANALLDVLQRAIGHAVNVVMSFLNEDIDWVLRPLHESGVLLTLIQVLRVEKMITTKVNGSAREIATSIECTAMHAIACVMHRDATIQTSFAVCIRLTRVQIWM